MNGTNPRSAGPLVEPRREKVRGANAIYLDRDALNPRGWISRRGRRLLERSSCLLSTAGVRLAGRGTWPQLPPGAQMNCSA